MSKGNSNHKTELANTVRSNQQTIKHSEAIWDDPDLIPHIQNSGENQFADKFEVVQASQSLGKSQHTNDPSMKSKGRAIWEKPGTAAQPYLLDSQGESQFAYNIADTAGDEQSSIIASAYKANQFQLQGNGESNISNLNLLPAAGISLHEQQTAELIQKDKELTKLKLCSPSQNNLLPTITESETARNRRIDELYEMRNSKNLPFAQEPPADEEQPLNLNADETSDIYPPQNNLLNYNPNFKEEEKREEPQVKKLKDQILDSTSGAPESFMDRSMAHLTRDGNQSKAESHKPHPGQFELAEKLSQIQNIFSEHKQLTMNEGGQVRPSLGKESSEVENA